MGGNKNNGTNPSDLSKNLELVKKYGAGTISFVVLIGVLLNQIHHTQTQTDKFFEKMESLEKVKHEQLTKMSERLVKLETIIEHLVKNKAN